MKDVPFTALLAPTLESTLEVVAICFGGWILSKRGILNRSVQKSLSAVNLNLFTPCLIFSKLASSLNLSVLADLWAMPLLFAIVCGVSWTTAWGSSRLWGIGKRWEKFVISCCMFQNSNSLPIAIVSSLAYTLDSDLYWDKIDMDTAEKVVSRGILYLLIFAQLGLMIRWSYGYRYLLAPENNDKYDLESTTSLRRTSSRRYQTIESDENTPFLRGDDQSTDGVNGRHSRHPSSQPSDCPSEYGYSTGATSPILATNEPFLTSNEEDITSFPAPFQRRPSSFIKHFLIMAWREFLEFMNMPLWAMLVAVLIALYPKLQHYLFFQKDGFIRGSVIYAIQTCGDVSIPLILVILGANIANEDEPHLVEDSQTDPVTDRKWSLTQRQRAIILAIVTRMVVVPLIICPLTIPVALWGVRYHMGVLCDPIFWVVCWLLIGSPTAVQLTQITQLNCVFEGEMATVLWWDYVVFCAPLTMFLVVGGLEVLGWAQRSASNVIPPL